MKKLLSLILSAMLLITVCSCGKTEQAKDDNTQQSQASEPIGFTIEMEDGSVMKGELYPDIAPITVANFVKLCNENFYAGTIFHRVIPGFMIQGGGFDNTLAEKSADEIKGEFAENGVKNDLKHERGVISMARTQVFNSASSQFFIMHDANASLDGNYAAFGKITEGMDVVDKIAATPTAVLNAMFQNIPVEAQVIKSITID